MWQGGGSCSCPLHLSLGSIVCLLFRRRPPAISRFIPFVVIYPINRVLRAGPFPNIRNKHGKIISPAVAHENSAACVSRVFLRIKRVASIPHVRPQRKQRVAVVGSCHSVLCSMKNLFNDTSARFSVSDGQRICPRDANRSAVANAFILNPVAMIGDSAQYNKAAKTRSRQILKSSHRAFPLFHPCVSSTSMHDRQE